MIKTALHLSLYALQSTVNFRPLCNDHTDLVDIINTKLNLHFIWMFHSTYNNEQEEQFLVNFNIYLPFICPRKPIDDNRHNPYV